MTPAWPKTSAPNRTSATASVAIGFDGSRKRTLSTRAGDIEIALPKLRQGSYYPEFLERRRRIDQALYGVIMTAYSKGVSTRKVDKLVEAMGVNAGISRSEVSRICKGIDELVNAFRERDLAHTTFPYLYLDATYVKARNAHAVRSRAVGIAMAINENGHRELLGLAIGHSEAQGFGEDLIASLVTRGLSGVRLVISDGNQAIGNAVTKLIPEAAWQTCRTHFGRNLLPRVRSGDRGLVAAGLASLFGQADKQSAMDAFGDFADRLERKYPELSTILEDSEIALTAYTAFPPSHWRKIWSTNPLERVMGELKRRTRVVQLFPDDDSVLRLIGAVLIEQNDEWLASERRYMSRHSMALIGQPPSPGERQSPLALPAG